MALPVVAGLAADGAPTFRVAAPDRIPHCHMLQLESHAPPYPLGAAIFRVENSTSSCAHWPNPFKTRDERSHVAIVPRARPMLSFVVSLRTAVTAIEVLAIAIKQRSHCKSGGNGTSISPQLKSPWMYSCVGFCCGLSKISCVLPNSTRYPVRSPPPVST